VHCRAVWRGRARQRLAPTTWDDPSPIGRRCITGWCHHARPVGVRRCLTRPARQGRQTTGGAMVTMPAGPSDRAMHATDCPAWWRARARRRLAPTTWRGAFPVGHMDTTGGAAPAL
jgi:hypothetical protein